MRISNEAIFNTFTKYDKVRQKEIARHTEEISSGKRILTPSDDFAAMAKSLKFKEVNKEIDNYLTNISSVKMYQTAAQTAMTNIADAGTEARTEIVRLLNTGVLDQEDAEIVNEYLQGLKDYMIDQANTKVADTYIFSGTKTDTKPLAQDGTYAGSERERKVPVAKSFEAKSTFSGKDRLGFVEIVTDNTTTPPKTVEKFGMGAVIDKIDEIIQSGDLTKMHENIKILNDQGEVTEVPLLELFDMSLKKLTQERSNIGAEQKVVEQFQEQHEMMKTNYNEFIASLEDADIPQSIAALEQAKVAYEASMAVFMQNKDLNLLKYLAA